MHGVTRACCLLAFGIAALTLRAQPAPRSWVDPETGHRVIQLSEDVNTASLYFTQYAYCASGTKVIMVTREEIMLVTLATGQIEHLYKGSNFRVIQAGAKSGKIYFLTADTLFVLDADSRQVRRIAGLPAAARLSTINVDETTAAGSFEDRPDRRPLEPPFPEPGERTYGPSGVQLGNDDFPGKIEMMESRFRLRRPTTLFKLDLQSGVLTPVLKTEDWLNHIQFSPTDPNLVSVCHEGPWWMVDRIWTLRLDEVSTPQLVHRRTMQMEIANHEFWSSDGQWLWYDLETPMNEDFWLAGYNVRDSRRIWYHLTLDQWSIHYNQSPDGRLFCGDGGEPGHLGPQPPHSKWIYLFHPEGLPESSGAAGGDRLIRVGRLRTERLVSLARHDYSEEPNANFTPDGKWIVFRSNMRGPIGVYAVEVALAK
jgi:oligogalacturonide lyase